MSDFISLVCPSCGGKLEVSPNATSLKCQHCGTEHMVKHEASGGVMLEAYARCPKCGRNDKSEKITAVIASQTQELSGVEEKEKVIVNPQGQYQVVKRSVPFTRKQVSILGQRLALPPKPAYPLDPPPSSISGGSGSGWGVMAIIVGALTLGGSTACCLLQGLPFILTLFTTYITQDELTKGILSLIGVVVLLLAGLAAIALGVFIFRRARKSRANLQKEYLRKIHKVGLERERIQLAWERAVQRWNQLYYCARDDCVFIPGENNSAPVTQLKEYLYQ